MKSKEDRLILVTNDDGVNAKGLASLIEVAREFGNVIVVAPETAQSGMGHAITVKYPLRLRKYHHNSHYDVYSCSGTPVDCVKIANSVILKQKPDLLLSGINHGSNASSSIFYSGTMGAALEGCLDGIPSIGFSLTNYKLNADFDPGEKFIRQIIINVLKNGLSTKYCLNVNIPAVPENELAGIKICRQARGYWEEDFEQRLDPGRNEYYWLTGRFINLEPDAEDTDEWALKHNFVSIVPVPINLTSESGIQELKSWNLAHELKTQ